MIRQMDRQFSKVPEDRGSIRRSDSQMVQDTSLLNIQHYKACIKGKVEQSKERITPWFINY